MRALLSPATIGLGILLSACATLPHQRLDGTDAVPPDYSRPSSWAARPDMRDSADVVPLAAWSDRQADAPIDVFFVHPTSYFGKSGFRYWNAPLDEDACNARTDATSMKYQASLFNGVGRIYAPRYRQAHLQSFFSRKTDLAAQALEVAYEDVRHAFAYYLDHDNQGRPFILASHSQGTVHASRLVKEFVDGKPLQQQLVAAYLVGFPVRRSAFSSVGPCVKPDDTGCICSWRTVREGTHPRRYHFADPDILVTNPVTWTADQPASSRDLHLGAILRDFHRLYPRLLDVRQNEDLLWVNKPKFPWSFLFLRKNYHIADYNFFYADVRHNALKRTKAYLAQHP